MERRQYLIDTNAVIDYLGNKLPAEGMAFINDVVDNIPNISIITKIEVLGFNTTEENHQILADFISDSQLYSLSENVVELCIEIRKKYKTKLPDAIIAATALTHQFTLISRNLGDFKNIESLRVIDPHSL